MKNADTLRAQLEKDAHFSFSEEAWAAGMMHMPFRFPENASSAREAMETPGCCVKSAKLRLGRFPLTARLLRLDVEGGHATVLSHPQTFGLGHYVWIGTVDEYFSIWECD